jgi:large subunit ribosomal protein L21
MIARLRFQKLAALTIGHQGGECSPFPNEAELLMYAIIEEGGRQFKVTSGDTIQIDRQVEDEQKSITFDRVLLVAGEGEPRIGAPLVSGATVTADVLGASKGPKVISVKYKRRKGYHKKIGHRQQYTSVRITDISI